MIKRMLMASLVVGFLGGMITLTGCEKDTKKGGGEEQTENTREVALKAANAEFVDKVVIPTYTDLAAAAKKLDDLVIALEADVNVTNIKAACDQWFIARALWERKRGVPVRGGQEVQHRPAYRYLASGCRIIAGHSRQRGAHERCGENGGQPQYGRCRFPWPGVHHISRR